MEDLSEQSISHTNCGIKWTHNQVHNRDSKVLGQIFAQTYNLEKVINKFGDKGLNSVLAEVNKINDRTCFRPIDVKNLTSQERKRSM